ncbi:MAG: adenylosuccinate lyase, partial [Puniceicoccales bacterium]|jgi:adenylosuccinate lyase|nr:adenylosuccinate lyase [Puniceicoccales bacterium]
MEAVKAGAGRETAHEIIKENAVAAARDLRSGATERNDLVARLAADPRLGLSRERLDAIVAGAAGQTGAAGAQVDAFRAEATTWLTRFPAAGDIKPGRML